MKLIDLYPLAFVSFFLFWVFSQLVGLNVNLWFVSTLLIILIILMPYYLFNKIDLPREQWSIFVKRFLKYNWKLFFTAIGWIIFTAYVFVSSYNSGRFLGIDIQVFTVLFIVPSSIILIFLIVKFNIKPSSSYTLKLSKNIWYLRKALIVSFYAFVLSFSYIVVFASMPFNSLLSLAPVLIGLCSIAYIFLSDHLVNRRWTSFIVSPPRIIRDKASLLARKIGLENYELSVLPIRYEALTIRTKEGALIVLNKRSLNSPDFDEILAHEMWHAKIDLDAIKEKYNRIKELKTFYTLITMFFATLYWNTVLIIKKTTAGLNLSTTLNLILNALTYSPR